MSLVLYGIGLAAYLAVGAHQAWIQVKGVFVWGRYHGVPVDRIRRQVPYEFASWLVFWPMFLVLLSLTRLYAKLLAKAERDSYTRAEQIARLEKELDRIRRQP